MQFQSARPEIIQAINQRWLFKNWNESRGTRPLPTWQGLESREFASMSQNLAFADVVGADGDMRFFMRYHGARIGEAYGSDCQGKYLDEVLPFGFHNAALATYRHAAATRLPVFTSVNVPDADGRVVVYERLLLPFGRDGKTVDRILASLEMISMEGAFDHRNLMASTQTPSSFAVCASIQPPAH